MSTADPHIEPDRHAAAALAGLSVEQLHRVARCPARRARECTRTLGNGWEQGQTRR